jgi:predicted metal-dependent hydrolase
MSKFFDLEGHGAEPIRYEVRASPRRRTMSIEVHPDSRIVVRVPARCAAGTVSSWVSSRAKWIERQLERFRRRGPAAPPYRYINGERHRYLGFSYPLKVIQGNPEGVTLAGQELVVSLTNGGPDPGAVNALLSAWYLERATAVFQAILNERHAAFFAQRGHSLPALIVKPMKRRWGSLSTSGRMALSVDLIRASQRHIELVVTHELCHLEQQNHGPRFYRLLEQAMPDWRECKRELEASRVMGHGSWVMGHA